MRWEAFCRALGRRFDVEPPQIHPLDPPPENAQELANAARELLQNPVFRLAMTRVQAGLADRWRHSPIGGRDEREAAYLLHCAIDEVRAELVRMTTSARRAA